MKPLVVLPHSWHGGQRPIPQMGGACATSWVTRRGRNCSDLRTFRGGSWLSGLGRCHMSQVLYLTQCGEAGSHEEARQSVHGTSVPPSPLVSRVPCDSLARLSVARALLASHPGQGAAGRSQPHTPPEQASLGGQLTTIPPRSACSEYCHRASSSFHGAVPLASQT